MKAIGTRVVIEMSERESITEGGIAIPESSVKPNTEGVIVSVGQEVTEDVKEGDTVGFPSHLGTRLEHAGKDILVIDASKLIYVRSWLLQPCD